MYRIGRTLTLTAFGIFARTLPKTEEYNELHRQLDGIELADSITIDGHKILNVVSPFAGVICIFCYHKLVTFN